MLDRNTNFAQYVINEIAIDFGEGHKLDEKVCIQFDKNSKRIIQYLSDIENEKTLRELLDESMKAIYPGKSEEAIELECFRSLTGLTVTGFAELCNVSKQAISQMLNGQIKPSKKVIDRIKTYLKL